MVDTTTTRQVRALVDKLLDRDYTSTVEDVLRGIGDSMQRGVMDQRLRELGEEAARLAAAGERMAPDNAVLRATLADLDDVMRRNAARLDGIADAVQRQGVEAGGTLARQLSLPGLDDTTLARLGVRWNSVDPEAVVQLIDVVNTPAWNLEMVQYGESVVDVVRNQAIRGVVEGWGPLRVAEEIARVARGLPVSRANVIMRTLQLQSYRRATALNYQANADIIEKQIRIGTLDTRICLACLAEHGREMPVGEIVADHHAGRCTSIAVVKGVPRTVATGEQWWGTLSEAQKIELAGPGKAELLRTGRAKLADFVEDYDDPVFGRMIREKPIKRLER